MALLTPTMQAARLKVVKTRPYLASILYVLQPVEAPGLGTFGVDKHLRLFFDPKCDEWGVDGVASVLYHEVSHVLRAHAERSEACGVGPEEATLSNLAADCEINDDLVEEGIKFPTQPAVPSMFGMKDKLFYEEYLVQLRQKAVKVSITVPGGAGPTRGKCGSAGGNPCDEEGTTPQDKDAPGISKSEADLIRRAVASEVRDANKTQGTVPGWLALWAEALLDPKVDWRKELAHSVRRGLADAAGMWDYSYKHPSRRNPMPGAVILPGFRAPRPAVAVVIDTSGSMGSDDLNAALAEIRGVLRSCGTASAGVRVYVTDHHVHSAKKVFRVEQIQLKGGGGTDMRLGISAAMADRPTPDIIIVLTDGYTPWPTESVGVRVIAALIGASPDTKVPEWIKKIIVEK